MSSVSSFANSAADASAPPPFEYSLLPALSGVWIGSSFPLADPSASTAWQNCRLTFGSDGRIEGSGQSQWRSELIDFSLVGTVEPQKASFELYKTHMGKYKNTILYRGVIRVDRWPFLIDGAYTGGKLKLTKLNANERNEQSDRKEIAKLPTIGRASVHIPLSSVSGFPLPGRANSEPFADQNQKREGGQFTNIIPTNGAPPLNPASLPAAVPIPVPAPIPSAISSLTSSPALKPSSSPLSNSPPSIPPLPRQHSASLQLLSGIWDGHSLQRPAVLTRFTDFVLQFLGSGAREGECEGYGIATCKGEQRYCRLLGHFDLASSSIRLIIASCGSDASKPDIRSSVYQCQIDIASLSIRGNFEEGEIKQTLVLTHTKRYPAMLPPEPPLIPALATVKALLAPALHHALAANPAPVEQATSMSAPPSVILKPASVDVAPPSFASSFLSDSHVHPPLSASVSLPLHYNHPESHSQQSASSQYRRAATVDSPSPAHFQHYQLQPLIFLPASHPSSFVSSSLSHSSALLPSLSNINSSASERSRGESENDEEIKNAIEGEPDSKGIQKRPKPLSEGEGEPEAEAETEAEAEHADDGDSASHSESESDFDRSIALSPGADHFISPLNDSQSLSNSGVQTQLAREFDQFARIAEGEPGIEPAQLLAHRASSMSVDEPGRSSGP